LETFLVHTHHMGAGRVTPEGRARLGPLIDQRARNLGLTLTEVARRAGLTSAGLRLIRTTASVLQQDSKDGIEDALLWEAGSVDAILAGDEPTPSKDEPTPSKPAVSRSGGVSAVPEGASGGGSGITFDEVLDHLHAAHALGYGWEALERMRNLHSPLVKRPQVEPMQSPDAGRSA
jgi:hypothetical protein